MKKELNKIITVIGFVLVVVGAVIVGTDSEIGLTLVLSTANIAAALATCFIFAKNATMRNVGYALAALTGAYGIAGIASEADNVGLMISSIGMILLLFAALLYVLIITLKFFGFVKGGKAFDCGDVSAILSQYKTMQEEKVISEEEFNELKQKTLEKTGDTAVSFDDLKKWKKLLDQQVITEDEFAAMKAKVFGK